ncbi:penicillin-insensitive murein endopeptidase [Serratia sp. UGAL515B_01]|uniref:penicillin-insensitive murein endopeptidase n=1 Tax=Serratia sp. UGAL515B_01 TaxID=2986763 RepID=UPI002953EFA4|nr:penicillin-insensitive murein endopeptidase [Serratia sp. UGAL515B_01]WON75709.1 penicillin-insensitive murein endopeptidase [Serratia sp. UGAL515B_01]
MKNGIFGLIALMVSGSVMALTPWQKIDHPVSGDPQAVGGFSNGCIIGAQPLPLNSPDYQVMRTDQRRYFGHPDLLAFIQRLSNKANQKALGTVLIGDMAMPAGGRFSSGHASHQSGLDVDIWLQLPRQRWSEQQLLKPQPIDLVSANGKQVVDRHWQPQIESLIKIAAQDSEVTRIFVNPAIKLRLCQDAGADRSWLHKVRPWFGHRAHMHVRLRCPVGNPECLDQDAPPAGDGCGAELVSWFKPPQPNANPTKTEPPPLPPSCQALLDNHFNRR